MHRVFYSDNGSTAMEISFKLALQYWKNKKIKNKTKLATLVNGYHGDTFGAMSVGYVPQFFQNSKINSFQQIKFQFLIAIDCQEVFLLKNTDNIV